MTLTRRRLDFLRIIKQVYESTNLPVHYARVAELLGVSKWSAYEMLKTLEKEGFLTSRYEVNQGEKNPGRAMVMFAPTQLVNQALSGKSLDFKMPIKEWRLIKERLLSLFEEPKKGAAKEITDQLISELPGVENPLVFCAYILTILIEQLQSLGEARIPPIKSMASKATKDPIGLAMFVGAGIGSLLKNTSQVQPVAQLTESLSRFQKNLSVLTQAEQTMLLDFFDNALAKAI